VQEIIPILQADFALNSNDRKRVREGLESDLFLTTEDGEEMNEKEMKKHLFCSHDQDFLRRVIQPRLLELKERSSSGQITWEHILLALQCLPHHKELLLVHEDLPPLPLSQDVMNRVQTRLFHRFAEVKNEGRGRQVTSVIEAEKDVRSSYKAAPNAVYINDSGYL